MKPVALFVSGDDEYTMQFEENGERSFCALSLKDESFQFEQNCTSTEAEKELVLACVEAFHESRRTLFENSEPMVSVVSGNPVVSTKKSLSPKRFEVGKELSEFRADIDCEGRPTSYDFKVVDNGVYIGIDGDENFWRDIGGELNTAKPLFKALTAFYKLRCGQL